jgi:hypothetical protein
MQNTEPALPVSSTEFHPDRKIRASGWKPKFVNDCDPEATVVTALVFTVTLGRSPSAMYSMRMELATAVLSTFTVKPSASMLT